MSRYRIKIHFQKEAEKKMICKRASRKTLFFIILSAIIYLLINFISMNIFAEFLLVRLGIAISSLLIIGIIAGSIIYAIEEKRIKSLRDVDQYYHYRYGI